MQTAAALALTHRLQAPVQISLVQLAEIFLEFFERRHTPSERCLIQILVSAEPETTFGPQNIFQGQHAHHANVCRPMASFSRQMIAAQLPLLRLRLYEARLLHAGRSY
jgi:hypothetical protein